MKNKMNMKIMVKLVFAFLLFLATLAVICFPLFVLWMGIFAPLSFWGHVAVTALGLFLCYLVKPVSILTGNDYQLF
jgi:hypothetical protein